jgi:hypothetical protein
LEKLKNAFEKYAYPDSQEDFIFIFEQAYAQITGRLIKDYDSAFGYGHGDMSGGYLVPKLWIETGFAMLLERY